MPAGTPLAPGKQTQEAAAQYRSATSGNTSGGAANNSGGAENTNGGAVNNSSGADAQEAAAQAELPATAGAKTAGAQEGGSEARLSEKLYAFGPYKRAGAGHEDGLVVLAMQLPYKLISREEGFYLLVDDAYKSEVAHQLYLARQERRRWKKLRAAINAPLPPDAPSSPWTLVIYAVILISFYLWQHSSGSAANRYGILNNQLILTGGEWWRLFTALTLHADIGHLVANIVSGIGLGLLANRTFGSGLTWLLTVLGGALGNLLTCWFYFPQSHFNYGASTAIFATLGMLIGHALLTTLNTHGRKHWRYYQMPLAVGLVVLALTGIDDTKSDVVAHISGFLVGIPFGVLAGWLRLRNPLNDRYSWLPHAATLSILALAWLFAVKIL